MFGECKTQTMKGVVEWTEIFKSGRLEVEKDWSGNRTGSQFVSAFPKGSQLDKLQ